MLPSFVSMANLGPENYSWDFESLNESLVLDDLVVTSLLKGLVPQEANNEEQQLRVILIKNMREGLLHVIVQVHTCTFAVLIRTSK